MDNLRRDSRYIRPLDCGPIAGWSTVQLPNEPPAVVIEPLASNLRDLARAGKLDAARTLFLWFR